MSEQVPMFGADVMPPLEGVPSDTAISPAPIADWLGDWADVDICAYPGQLVMARRYVVLPDDGLEVCGRLRGCTIYCNPPYSKPAPWVVACVAAVRRGCSVVLALRGDVTTAASELAISTARQCGSFAGLTRNRLAFGLPREGEIHFGNAANFASLIVGLGTECPDPPAGFLWGFS